MVWEVLSPAQEELRALLPPSRPSPTVRPEDRFANDASGAVAPRDGKSKVRIWQGDWKFGMQLPDTESHQIIHMRDLEILCLIHK